jgi:gamma-glutamyltranspeptidase / glutathione hydrolase
MIEAKKLVTLIMYVGGPRPTTVPSKQLISKELADERSKLIDMNKAACQVVPSEGETELDKHRN